MTIEYILNGQASGSVAGRLIACNMDAGAMRPYLGPDGRSVITVNKQTFVTNAPTPFTKDAWKELDAVVIKAAMARLKLVTDLRAAGLSVSIGNGMGKTSFEFQSVSDIDDAAISMDPVVRSRGDRPYTNLKNIPLPVIHKDVMFSARDIAISRNGGVALDTTSLDLQTRKVAEMAEKLAIGIGTPYTVGGGILYGLTTFPQRLTFTIDLPTGGTWTPTKTLENVLAMKDLSQAAFHYGPWKLYCSTNWDKYMDNDFSAAKGDLTLRQRLSQVEGIQGVVSLDYLSGYQLLLVQMTQDCIREVIGMEVQPIQWEEAGGMEVHMKVMGIMVPNPRADFYDRTGIVHGS